MTKKFGFTLAEVLITLGIIGVVAAMTIPTLMNQTGQAEFKTGLKKAVSVLNQAITMNVALNNTDFSTLVSGSDSSSSNIYNMFTSRINIISATSGTTTALGAPFQVTGNYTLFFNDGMAITFPQTAMSCTSSGSCKAVIDVNGVKKPNSLSLSTTGNTTAGIKDEFVLDMYNQQVMPRNDAARYVMFN